MTEQLIQDPLFYLLAVISLGRLVANRMHGERGFEEFVLMVYGMVLCGLGFWHKQPWPYFFVLLIPTCFVLIASLMEEGSLFLRPVPINTCSSGTHSSRVTPLVTSRLPISCCAKQRDSAANSSWMETSPRKRE